MRAMRYLPAYTIPLSAFAGLWLGGHWVWITAVYVFVIIPSVEILVGRNPINMSDEDEAKAKDSIGYSLILWFFVPVQYALTGSFLYLFSTGALSTYETIGGIAAVGISNGGIGITISHELIHRSSKAEQWLGRILLMSCWYMHFAIEHVRGHHVFVATHHDHASAKRGETFYSFWMHTVPGQWVSAWKLELQRMRKFGWADYSVHNEMIVFMIMQLSVTVLIGIIGGAQAVLVFLATSVVAFSLLEVVNYVEHYGLERRMKANGRFEKVNHHHSWNSDHEISRLLLFELTRHSDHHAKASRKYQVLRTFDDSPQLPTGYPGMILLALFPPVWFKVMNPLVDRRKNLVLNDA